MALCLGGRRGRRGGGGGGCSSQCSRRSHQIGQPYWEQSSLSITILHCRGKLDSKVEWGSPNKDLEHFPAGLMLHNLFVELPHGAKSNDGIVHLRFASYN